MKKLNLTRGSSLEGLARDEVVEFMGQKVPMNYIKGNDEAQILCEIGRDIFLLTAYLKNGYEIESVINRQVPRGSDDFEQCFNYMRGLGL